MADLYGTSPSSDVVALPHDPQDFSSSSSFINPNKFVPFLHSQPPWHSPSLAGASCTLDFPDDRRAFTHALPDSRFADFLKQGSDSVFSSSGAGGGDSDANAPWKRRDLSSDNDLADFSCDSEGGDVPELPSSTDLSRNSSKRSRSAEVHNMSEKRRRRRINEKMKALQNLIPNSNKTDKASMLDEAIEYLKQLQVQVQMLSMRNGLSLQPMCLPGMMQPIQLPHMGLDFDVGNAFLASRRGIDASSTGNEGCPMQSIFSLSNKCNLSDQSIAIPSVPNTTTPETTFGFEPAIQAYNGQFDLSSDFKDVQPATQIDCARTGKDSADVS